MAGLRRLSLIAVTALVTVFAVQSARATQAPADPCSLLPAAAVGKAMGRAYGAPHASTAPRPYRDSVEGTDCRYEPSGAGSSLLFRVYFDPSPSAASGLFARLKMFFAPQSTAPGVGDEAYFDRRHGLHVLKGNVRFFLSGGENEKPLTDLARQVAGRL